jgi:DNA replicative helicase MCM subunit Mcm2 (Cdc46/Mcm family)
LEVPETIKPEVQIKSLCSIFALSNTCYSTIFICYRAYISAARRVIPSVPRELEEYIATAYSSIRQEEAKSNAPTSYTTIRTLLSILRISIVSNLTVFPSQYHMKNLSLT